MASAPRFLTSLAGVAFFATPALGDPPANPLLFFEGRTVSEGTIRIAFKKPFRSHSIGRGRIEPDGTLVLVQQVREGAAPPRERRWVIRRAGPTRFTGTMTDAIGPITIEKTGEKFHFRFRMKGGLAAEQWVTPLPGGKAATSRMVVRKLGLIVASSIGTIHKPPVR